MTQMYLPQRLCTPAPAGVAASKGKAMAARRATSFLVGDMTCLKGVQDPVAAQGRGGACRRWRSFFQQTPVPLWTDSATRRPSLAGEADVTVLRQPAVDP